MRILSLSTYNEPCGLASYNSQLRDAVVALGHEYDVFPIDTKLYLTRARVELLAHFEPFLERCRAYDALVIQHEYGIYDAGYGIKASLQVFSKLLRRVTALGKPTLVLFHSDPPPRARGQRLKLLRRWSSTERAWKGIVRAVNRSHRTHVVVHGPEARRRFIDRGLMPPRVLQILHPFPTPAATSHWRPKDAQRSDIVLAIFGFLAPYKGYETALAAMNLLPVNYRLIIAGGLHPRAVNDRTLSKILEALGAGRFGPEMQPVGAKPGSGGADATPTAANRIGAVRRVTITGWLAPEDVRKVFAAADIILAPYTEHGPAGSGALSWGISAGRPVIATRTRPFLELERESPCLRLVTQNAPFELAREILSVASDLALQEKMVAQGRELAFAHDWKHAAAYFLSVLGA